MPLTKATIILVPTESRVQVLPAVKDQPRTQLVPKQSQSVTVTHNSSEPTTLTVPNEERKGILQ